MRYLKSLKGVMKRKGNLIVKISGDPWMLDGILSCISLIGRDFGDSVHEILGKEGLFLV